VIDHRRFLDRREERVLAYLGGNDVVAADRGLRVEAPVAPGWWRFELRGRAARALEPVSPPDELLAALPSTVGHWSGARLAHASGPPEPLLLLPEDELPRFSPCRARRWHSGDLLFERLELEGEAEELARRAFEDRRGLGGAKGIAGTLRAAFALAVVADASRASGIAAAPIEVGRDLLEIAERGWAAADAALERLRREREAHAAREREARASRARAASPARAARADSAADTEARVRAALAGSGATLLDLRRLVDGMLVVTYRFMGERLRAIVRPDSLQVFDAGVCLSGEDAELTLASLPGVIREGLEDGLLVITNHA
jgi:hypothetical protein